MKSIIFVLTVLLFNFSIAQTSEIRGVVTYFFNEYQGDKPDMGAKVYVIDSLANPDFDYKLFYNFDYGKSYRGYYSNFINKYEVYDGYAKKYEGKKKYKTKYDEYLKLAAENKVFADNALLQMETFGVDTEEKYTNMCSKIFMVFTSFMNPNGVKKETRTVDGSGNYSLKLASGTYYVLIKSKNRTGLNIAEMDGDVYSKKVKLKVGETIDVSHNFEVN